MKISENPIHWLQCKSGRALQATRRLALALFFVTVAVSAHPVGIMTDAGNACWLVLSPLGLDVAMTPFTAEMMFVGKNRKVPQLDVIDGATRKSFSLGELDLYQVRIPLLLMAEREESNLDISLHTHAICRSLSRHLGRKVKTWARSDQAMKVYFCDGPR